MTIRMKPVLLVVTTLLLGRCSAPQETEQTLIETQDLPGSYYVTGMKSHVHLGPDASAKVTNTLYRQQRVEVFEMHGEWARITRYYDGAGEGIYGSVARWVLFNDLETERPDDLPQPSFPDNPRIELPKVGDNDLSETDVRILYAAALYYLESGKLKRIEWGDKSLHKPGYYYLSSGPKNHFFRPRDIPNLEQRIQATRHASAN